MYSRVYGLQHPCLRAGLQHWLQRQRVATPRVCVALHKLLPSRDVLRQCYSSESKKASLKENVVTVPNAISVARAAVAPYIAHLMVIGDHRTALGVLFVAGVSDLVDGWIARRYVSQRSVFGTALDPICDKILMLTTMGAATVTGLLPVPLVALMVGRDVGLMAGGFVYRYRSLEPPVTLSKYFDATHASTEFHPTTISKINTALQLVLLGAALAQPAFDIYFPQTFDGLCWVIAGTTIASGLSYWRGKGTISLHRASITKARDARGSG